MRPTVLTANLGLLLLQLTLQGVRKFDHNVELARTGLLVNRVEVVKLANKPLEC